MDLEEAVLVLAEYEGEGVEHLVCPQPDVPGFAVLDGRFELPGQGFARHAIEAVSRDQQIIAVQLRDIVDLLAEAQVDADFAAALLQDVEQGHTRNTRDNVTPAVYDFAAIAHIDSVPLDKLVSDLFV